MAECRHLVDEAACGDCRPRTLPDSSLWERQSPHAASSYPGECDGCGDDIEPGDGIRADGQGGWLCEECGRDGPHSFSRWAAEQKARDNPDQAELRRRFEAGYS